MLAILNAIFAYLTGLFQSAGFVLVLFPGWWLMQALGQRDWMQALPLLAFAMGACGAGVLVSIKENRQS
jgi:hypothetical protein